MWSEEKTENQDDFQIFGLSDLIKYSPFTAVESIRKGEFKGESLLFNLTLIMDEFHLKLTIAVYIKLCDLLDSPWLEWQDLYPFPLNQSSLMIGLPNRM